jgi:lipopolysaccharide cholinephosphotransferase
LPFENIEVPVPIGYDKVLSKQYGNNYMTPIHITSMHGEEILFDTKKSYKEYLPLLRKERNKEFRKKRIDNIQKFLKFK